ncbi:MULTISPECIES: pantoate--beta-alanine ligase [unclassified Bacillus (in: firmicutes)]|uniref:pantoate--beta-alanine ligase n=1 Tax=unclassified Bacillus (in: firmicutes) TaxID=185979 RepID=UPI0008EFDBC0|nr:MULTISPECIES: pantoate--beta-alanine ligase [unclassified Bacillus (in: firmicutes)]SFA98797.1 pantoate--beta-alanine ligase [Bacillus sp. UNCCL13]SFQ81296.1 pantoate--beta-alanine ligase [Bacillus sp. cl95]
MKVITTIQEMQLLMKKEQQLNHSIGYVPTMGFLHEGHESLLKQSRKENQISVLSIFVNPLQFGPKEDLSTYPRDFDRDRKVGEECGVDYIFYPSVEEMYPSKSSVKVVVEDRTNVLCGKSRLGHFDGVATVLTKLFHIIMPTRAYFGMKDAQQVAVVEGLINDFNFPITVVRGTTVRERDGLAKSSRNVYLSERERSQAPALYKSLQVAKSAILKGERNPDTLRNQVIETIERETSGQIDYVEVYNYPELTEVNELEGTTIIAIAVKFSKARLIDNILINREELK